MTPVDTAAIAQRVEAIHGFEWDGEFLAEVDAGGTWDHWARKPYSTEACELIAAAPADIRALLSENASLKAEVAALTAALQELYDAATVIERQIPVATEDWHHALFAATGNAFTVLGKHPTPANGGSDDDE